MRFQGAAQEITAFYSELTQSGLRLWAAPTRFVSSKTKVKLINKWNKELLRLTFCGCPAQGGRKQDERGDNPSDRLSPKIHDARLQRRSPLLSSDWDFLCSNWDERRGRRGGAGLLAALRSSSFIRLIFAGLRPHDKPFVRLNCTENAFTLRTDLWFSRNNERQKNCRLTENFFF